MLENKSNANHSYRVFYTEQNIKSRFSTDTYERIWDASKASTVAAFEWFDKLLVEREARVNKSFLKIIRSIGPDAIIQFLGIVILYLI